MLVTLLGNAVYGTQSDGPLKSSLKSTSDCVEVINHCQFLSDAMSEIATKNKEETAGHPNSGPVDSDVKESEVEDQAAETGLHDLVSQDVINNDSEGKLDEWLSYLNTRFESFVSLVVDADTRDDLAAALGQCEVLQKVQGPCMLLYDSKIAGEASSNPNCRLPPFQSKHLRKIVQAMVSLRGNDGDDQLPEGDLRRKDLIVVLDGGRSGNDSAVNQALVDVNGRAMNKVKQCFTLLYDEESLGERKERVKGFLQQVEGLNVYSTERPGARKMFAQTLLWEQPWNQHWPSSCFAL